jgi:hypothetical protein
MSMADATKLRWISCEDTHVLMRFAIIGQRGEWVPVAHVTLRQVYTQLPAAYYACVPTDPHNEIVGQSHDLEEAKKKAEHALGV